MTVALDSQSGPSTAYLTDGTKTQTWTHAIPNYGGSHAVLFIVLDMGTSTASGSGTTPPFTSTNFTSDQSGMTFTLLGSSRTSTSNTGWVGLAAVMNPTPNVTHTLTGSATTSATVGIFQCRSLFFTGLAAYDTVQNFGGTNTSGPSSASMTTATGYYPMYCASSSAAMTSFNQTTLYTNGATASGLGDYLRIGTGTPSGSTISFTDTATHFWGAVGINMLPYVPGGTSSSAFLNFFGGGI